MHFFTSQLLVTLSSMALFALRTTTAAPIGALFFIDNNLDQNSVVGLHIKEDGTLSTATRTPTGGKGAVGKNSTGGDAGPDALFGQGSVAIGKEKLFAVNAGSNTVAFFTFNAKHPTALQIVGSPAYSGGEFPVSVAFNEKRSIACVLNSGAKDGVRCFKVDPTKGLTTIENTDRTIGLGQTTPPVGPPNTVSQVIFDASGDNLLVSVKGIPPSSSGYIASYAIAADGSLAAKPVKTFPNGGLSPFGMTRIPGTQSVIVTDPAIGVTVYNFASAGTEASSVSTAIDGQIATCWVAHSPKTENYYVADVATGTVVELSADANEAKVVKITNLDVAIGVIDLAVADTKNGPDFLYVNGAGTQTIQRFSLYGPGDAILDSPFNVGEEVTGLTKNMVGMVTFLY